MRKKMLMLEQKIGAKLIGKKQRAMERAVAIKDSASAEPIIIIAVLCIAIVLLIFGKPLLEGVISSLSGKAQNAVETQF